MTKATNYIKFDSSGQLVWVETPYSEPWPESVKCTRCYGSGSIVTSDPEWWEDKCPGCDGHGFRETRRNL